MNHTYIWDELGPFWFRKTANEDMLHVAHRSIFGELVFLIHKEDQEEIRNLLVEYLPYVEVPEKSATEKLSDWFSKKFPLEKPATPPPASS